MDSQLNLHWMLQTPLLFELILHQFQLGQGRNSSIQEETILHEVDKRKVDFRYFDDISDCCSWFCLHFLYCKTHEHCVCPLSKMNYTFSIHIMYMKYTTLGILQVYYVYSFSIHMMYTFCISNLEHLEVYKKYTSQKTHTLIVYTFCTQKTPQEVYFLYT